MKNPLDLYRLLPKSNCRQCLLPSCMAFAVAVIQGQKAIGDCPHVAPTTIEAVNGKVVTRKSFEEEQQERLIGLKQAIATVDFVSVADGLGAKIIRGELAVPCLGKDFIIDQSGEMSSACHHNLWVQVPLLNYILQGKGNSLSGRLVSFAELPGAGAWSRFFAHRCEGDMKKLADAHNELFFEILDLFGGRQVTGLEADHSLIIYPLPKLPLVVNYWEPESGFTSKLNLLFDETSTNNLNIDSIYVLCRGLVEMLRALIVRHNRDGKLF